MVTAGRQWTSGADPHPELPSLTKGRSVPGQAELRWHPPQCQALPGQSGSRVLPVHAAGAVGAAGPLRSPQDHPSEALSLTGQEAPRVSAAPRSGSAARGPGPAPAAPMSYWGASSLTLSKAILGPGCRALSQDRGLCIWNRINEQATPAGSHGSDSVT